MEKLIERGLFASRWLMAPMYIGLVGALLLLLWGFLKELLHLFTDLGNITQYDVILGTLALIDLTLAGNLVLIVIFSGYENFVSQLDIDEGKEKLSWLGKMDSGSLKMKVAASIVAISSIHLLKTFIEIGNLGTPGSKLTESGVMWQTIIHGMFIVSALGIAWVDRMSNQKH